MQHATQVLAFNGVEVGELVEANEDIVRFRTPDGRVVAISAQAVFDHRGRVLRLICYDTGVHRWEVQTTEDGRDPVRSQRPKGDRPGSRPG